ncbi:hypothetical protein CYMTET_16285 [Cymbomonas tetramitiformis]|uniref:Uncharacterized protein n=1 Tax=Cymbomonas tetramitiformis TaxID=36881 RepID=A0AAE0L8F0_9CHLO|nr:hypothetical protein CYMTET_16285 [Cymbomonas tetramitiformis]
MGRAWAGHEQGMGRAWAGHGQGMGRAWAGRMGRRAWAGHGQGMGGSMGGEHGRGMEAVTDSAVATVVWTEFTASVASKAWCGNSGLGRRVLNSTVSDVFLQKPRNWTGCPGVTALLRNTLGVGIHG